MTESEGKNLDRPLNQKRSSHFRPLPSVDCHINIISISISTWGSDSLPTQRNQSSHSEHWAPLRQMTSPVRTGGYDAMKQVASVDPHKNLTLSFIRK